MSFARNAFLAAGLAAAASLASVAHADITVGVTVSATGPAASLGIPSENSIKLWPTELGGDDGGGQRGARAREEERHGAGLEQWSDR